MKNIFIIIGALLLPCSLFATDKEINVRTKIESVTVYLSGAEISRHTSLMLNPGRAVLKFSQLSAKIKPASITAFVSGKVKILSILHQYNFLSDSRQNYREEQLKDSLELLSFRAEKIRGERSAFMEEYELLTENKSRLGKDQGVTTTELASAAGFFRSRLNEINSKMLQLNVQEKKFKMVIQRLQDQLTEMNSAANRHVSEILITVDAPASAKVDVHLRYLVEGAAWSPRYDLRTEGAGAKIKLDYRAEVLNNSDEEWPNTELTLSTADPSKGMEKPSLQPWGLSYTRNRRGRVIHQTNSGSEGLLNSWQPKPGDHNTENKKREVEVSYSNIEVSELSVDFRIREPYSIFSDGKIYLVDVNEYVLDASYNYFAIPKADKDAFLVAKITGWESLNLIEGTANVFLNGTYIGQTLLDTRYSNDTLELCLGRDRKVNINRTKRQDYNSQKLIGMNRSESFTYEIDVRNNNSVPIVIELQDQVPITQESDIEINVSEISGAQHDPLSGKLVWNLSLAPNESKKLSISFTVKYPRNKDIIIRKSRIVACPKFRN